MEISSPYENILRTENEELGKTKTSTAKEQKKNGRGGV